GRSWTPGSTRRANVVPAAQGRGRAQRPYLPTPRRMGVFQGRRGVPGKPSAQGLRGVRGQPCGLPRAPAGRHRLRRGRVTGAGGAARRPGGRTRWCRGRRSRHRAGVRRHTEPERVTWHTPATGTVTRCGAAGGSRSADRLPPPGGAVLFDDLLADPTPVGDLEVAAACPLPDPAVLVPARRLRAPAPGGGAPAGAGEPLARGDVRLQEVAELGRVLGRQVYLVLHAVEAEFPRLVGLGLIEVVDQPGNGLPRH